MYNLYLNFTIRLRIFILCFCYTLCITATLIIARTQSLALSIGAAVLFALCGLLFGAINMWSITNSIARVLEYLREMASGNLQREITIKRNNEISAVLRAIRDVQQSMRSIITGICSASGHVSSSSDRLGRTSREIASETEKALEQARSVSNAIDELASVSNDISNSCMAMSDLASAAEQASGDGEQIISGMSVIMGGIEQVMNETTHAVRSLGSNSTHIGNILATIGDIADQTNLLALNAAIEAARAGEQGRGFAVVADEVRSLAERTTVATREIQAIIDALQGDVKNVVSSMELSADTVREGGEGAGRSCDAIGLINRQILILRDNVAQVATAATEQSSTTAAMSGTIHLIAGVIGEAAAGAEGTRAAAAELAASASELQRLVSRFSV